MDKEDGSKEAKKKEKAHRGSRKSFMQTFAESTGGEASGGFNHGAGVKESDSIEAGIEIDTDVAALGFLTTCVMVWDKDYESAKQKCDYVKNIINSAGFTCKEETFNALEAWKSMMPGQVFANYRALPVMTTTLSHVIPLSSVWAGMRHNLHAMKITGVDIPHLICSTAEGTPFYMNINPTDVGHTAVWGPTGAGKSTLLNLLEMQFFKYPGSRVIVFDKGKSCRLPCLSCGGLFYEPAAEGAAGISFQPLRELETDSDLIYAMDFIESLFAVNNYPVTPTMRKAIKESLDLLREKDTSARTLTSFVHYVNYIDPDSGRPVFKEQLGDYLIDGGKFGKIFDARSSNLSFGARFITIEMEELMNRGEGCIVPALVYLFNTVEKLFSGNLTLLVLDEAWLFLRNEIFANKILEWLKVLRKKNVFVVFATQDVADVERSPLKSTIIQQCLTKIYLADPSAANAGMVDVYRAFGLTDSEISVIANATMKRDYFYTSPLGRRLFQLDLGPLTLGVIGSPDHAAIDALLSQGVYGSSLLCSVLDSKRIDWKRYYGRDAPRQAVSAPTVTGTGNKSANDNITSNAHTQQPQSMPRTVTAGGLNADSLLDALSSFPKKKLDKDSAALLMDKFKLSRASVYSAFAIVQSGNKRLIEQVKEGTMSIKRAYNIIKETAPLIPEEVLETLR